MQNCYNTGERIPREKRVEVDDRLANKHIQTLQFVQEVVNENKVLKKRIEELELSTSNCDELHALAEEGKEKIKTMQEQYLKRADEINAMMAEKHREEVRMRDRADEVRAVLVEKPMEQIRVGERADEVNTNMVEKPFKEIRVRERADEINAMIMAKHREEVRVRDRSKEISSVLAEKQRERVRVRDRANKINAILANKEKESVKCYQVNAPVQYKKGRVEEKASLKEGKARVEINKLNAEVTEEQKRKSVIARAEGFGALYKKSKGKGRVRNGNGDNTSEIADKSRERTTRVSSEISYLNVEEHMPEGRVRGKSYESSMEMAEKLQRGTMNNRADMVDVVIAKKSSREGKLRDRTDPTNDQLTRKLWNSHMTADHVDSENNNEMLGKIEGNIRDRSDEINTQKSDKLRRGQVNGVADMIDSVIVHKGRGEGRVKDRADVINAALFKEIGRKKVIRSVHEIDTTLDEKHSGEFSKKADSNSITTMKHRGRERRGANEWTTMAAGKHRREKTRDFIGNKHVVYEAFPVEVAYEDKANQANIIKAEEGRKEEQLSRQTHMITSEAQVKDPAEENNVRTRKGRRKRQVIRSIDISAVMPSKEVVEVDMREGIDEIKPLRAEVYRKAKFDDLMTGGQVKSSANEISTITMEEHNKESADEVNPWKAQLCREERLKGKAPVISSVMSEISRTKRQGIEERAKEISATKEKVDRGEEETKKDFISSMMMEKHGVLGQVRSIVDKINSVIAEEHSRGGQVGRDTIENKPIKAKGQIRSSANENNTVLTWGQVRSSSTKNNAVAQEHIEKSADKVKPLMAKICKEERLKGKAIVTNPVMSEIHRTKKQTDQETAEEINTLKAREDGEELLRDSANVIYSSIVEKHGGVGQVRRSINDINAISAEGQVICSTNDIDYLMTEGQARCTSNENNSLTAEEHIEENASVMSEIGRARKQTDKERAEEIKALMAEEHGSEEPAKANTNVNNTLMAETNRRLGIDISSPKEMNSLMEEKQSAKGQVRSSADKINYMMAEKDSGEGQVRSSTNKINSMIAQEHIEEGQVKTRACKINAMAAGRHTRSANWINDLMTRKQMKANTSKLTNVIPVGHVTCSVNRINAMVEKNNSRKTCINSYSSNSYLTFI